MRYPLLFLLFIGLFACTHQKEDLNSEALLQKSITFHDPQNHWNTLDFTIHIQEPRVGNPLRFSELKLNNQTGAFSLSRNRGERLATYQIDDAGNSSVLLDHEPVSDTALISKYRLNPELNTRYKGFYQMMYGLPMSLDQQVVEAYGSSTLTQFNGAKSYKVEVTLKEPMFSKHWILYLSEKDYKLQGLEIVYPDEPEKGERLYFDQILTIEGVKIPRIRHWHDYKDDTYAGSDVIVKEL